MTTDKDELAALKARVAELEQAAKPKPEPSWEERERAAAKWRDEMHQLAERRMSMATPPSVVRDWNVLPEHIVKGIREDRHAPTGPAGSAIPSSQPVSNVRTGGSSTPGWVDPIPLGPQPGIYRVDEQCIADEVRQRAELARKLGK